MSHIAHLAAPCGLWKVMKTQVPIQKSTWQDLCAKEIMLYCFLNCSNFLMWNWKLLAKLKIICSAMPF